MRKENCWASFWKPFDFISRCVSVILNLMRCEIFETDISRRAPRRDKFLSITCQTYYKGCMLLSLLCFFTISQALMVLTQQIYSLYLSWKSKGQCKARPTQCTMILFRKPASRYALSITVRTQLLGLIHTEQCSAGDTHLRLHGS